MKIDFTKLDVSGVTKLRDIGKSLGVILHKNLFTKFTAIKGDNLIVYYDGENDCIIIKKGGM